MNSTLKFIFDKYNGLYLFIIKNKISFESIILY